MNHTYETTYEAEDHLGNVIGSLEVRIIYTVNWGCPARIHYDEHDHPAEGDELEIVKFEVESVSLLGKPVWRNPSQMENGVLESWANNARLREDMLFEAREVEAAAEDEAKEHAAEAREDLRRMEEDK